MHPSKLLPLFGLLLGVTPTICLGQSKPTPSQPAPPQISAEPSDAEARKSIEAVLKKGAPLGSTRAQVEKWLTSHEGSGWYVEKKQLGQKDYAAALKAKGYKPADLGGIMLAMSEEQVRNIPYFAASWVYFSNEGKVIDWQVAQVGPQALKPVPGKPTLAQFTAMLKQGVHLGWSQKQVAAWLDSKKIERGPYEDGTKEDLSLESVVVQSKHRPADLGGIIGAIVRDISRNMVMDSNLVVTFFFDKKGRLIDYTVDEEGIGP